MYVEREGGRDGGMESEGVGERECGSEREGEREGERTEGWRECNMGVCERAMTSIVNFYRNITQPPHHTTDARS